MGKGDAYEQRKANSSLVRCVDNSGVAACIAERRSERRSCRLAQTLLVNTKDVILECNNLQRKRSTARQSLTTKTRTISLSSPKRKLSCTTRSSYFLISYLSICPFFTFAKSHAITYCPVDVTIAFSSCPSPTLNLGKNCQH
jgi:hypothetical protein